MEIDLLLIKDLFIEYIDKWSMIEIDDYGEYANLIFSSDLSTYVCYKETNESNIIFITYQNIYDSRLKKDIDNFTKRLANLNTDIKTCLFHNSHVSGKYNGDNQIPIYFDLIRIFIKK